MPIFSRDDSTKLVHDVKSTDAIFERREFKFEFPENGGVSFALIGSTRSGKSTVMCHLFEEYFKKHLTILMTLSSHADIYSGLKKHALVSQGYHRQLIEEPMKLNRGTGNKYPTCLIFDDLCLDGKNDKAMTKLLTIGRNQGMSAIIAGQKLTMLNATGRSNVNYVCCFKQNTETAIKDTVETYLRSYFPAHMSIAEMCKLYKEFTQDHNFFVVDTLNDKCFVTKLNLSE